MATYPRNRQELSEYMDEIAELMTDFALNLPEHGDLLALQDEASPWNWTETYQEQVDDLGKSTGIHFSIKSERSPSPPPGDEA
jgi:hypothetical protein